MKKLKLFFLLLFFGFSVFAEMGSCSLSQDSDGHYTIYCHGDGVVLQYETLTNEVYLIGNCTGLVSQLNEAYNDLVHDVVLLRNYIANAQDGLADSYNMVGYLESSTNSGELVTVFDARLGIIYAQSQLDLLQSKLDDIIHSMDSTESDEDLRSLIDSIDCGSCSSGGGDGGSCCDFSSILSALNDIKSDIENVSDYFGYAGSSLTSQNPSRRYRRAYLTSGPMQFSTNSAYQPVGSTQASFLSTMNSNLQSILPSINNWLSYISENQIKPAYDSIFLDKAPLYYYNSSSFTNYYAYLTNHYIQASLLQLDSSYGEQQGLTNWFSRIETLLAAIVFSDSSTTTNLAEVSSDQETKNQEFIDTMSSITDGFTERVKNIEDTSQGILDSLKVLRQGFSSFSTLPSTVTLATIPDFTPSESTRSSSSSSDLDISFQSSEMIYIINACRCVTTLAWCIGGVWLLFIFVSWSYKQCYNMAMFAWGVFSSIFKSS